MDQAPETFGGSVTRRELLAGLGGLATANLLGAPAEAQPRLTGVASPGALPLPRKQDFSIPPGHTYLNSAYMHPMSVASAENVRRYVMSRAQIDGAAWDRIDVKAEFASLINAKPSEIAFVPNTTTGENLVVNGLELLSTGGNVVTDALHFEGALIHLQSLQRQGLDLRMITPRDWRIELQDLERVVDGKTKLVELSLVAMLTGFQHDLKAVCDLAHAHGALVYADVVQAAGSTPIDVKASGVDFCACSSFKWLMGDLGLGFLYVREELLDRVVHRSQYGYYQAEEMVTHFLPHDPAAEEPFTFRLWSDARGLFEVGSTANAAWAALSKSLPYIRKIGVESIEAHRQPMLRRLHKEMPRLGFQPLTPLESKSSLVTFARKGIGQAGDRLKAARISARLGRHYIRISPSVFNDMTDIEALLQALSDL